MTDRKKSPLEKLVDFQQRNKNLPVKVQPKSRKIKAVTPIIEEEVLPEVAQEHADEGGNLIIANSSLTMNFNFNIDSDAMDKAIKTSAKVAKKIAAAGAAMIGTAIFFNSSKRVLPKKPTVNLKPKVKVPKFRSDQTNQEG